MAIINGTNGNDTRNGTNGDDEIYGLAGNDTLYGLNGSDYINGGAGNDSLYGGEGDDYINGGEGIDRLEGGNGNDFYVVDSSSDVIVENGTGRDAISASLSWTLASTSTVEDLLLSGSGAINGTGNSLNNSITGNGGNNTLDGGSGNDIINGGSGDDILVGGLGDDTLNGGAGSDRFVFNASNQGIDNLTDFVVSDDTIEVSAAGFGGGLIAGAAIALDQFVIGSTSVDDSDRFIYNSTNGALLFDADGTGAIAQIQIATLSTGLALTNADLVVI
jgi:Ca2+-binding RTX toxin-like protein